MGQTFAQNEHVVACDLEGGKALLDLQKSEYFKLNKTAALIWDALAEPKSADQLVGMITERFDVKPDVCRSDIENILDSFKSAGMISARE